MPWDWPVDVNYHEAKAYCTWKGPEYRLPTEGEYYRMRNEEVRNNRNLNHYYLIILHLSSHQHQILNVILYAALK